MADRKAPTPVPTDQRKPEPPPAPPSKSGDEYYARIRAPLLYYFGTTDVGLLTEIWSDQARELDERRSLAMRAEDPNA
jgi:hypothetical protein